MKDNIGSFNASKLVAGVTGRLQGSSRDLTAGAEWPSRVGSKFLKQGLESSFVPLAEALKQFANKYTIQSHCRVEGIYFIWCSHNR